MSLANCSVKFSLKLIRKWRTFASPFYFSGSNCTLLFTSSVSVVAKLYLSIRIEPWLSHPWLYVYLPPAPPLIFALSFSFHPLTVERSDGRIVGPLETIWALEGTTASVVVLLSEERDKTSVSSEILITPDCRSRKLARPQEWEGKLQMRGVIV